LIYASFYFPHSHQFHFAFALQKKLWQHSFIQNKCETDQHKHKFWNFIKVVTRTHLLISKRHAVPFHWIKNMLSTRVHLLLCTHICMILSSWLSGSPVRSLHKPWIAIFTCVYIVDSFEDGVMLVLLTTVVTTGECSDPQFESEWNW